MVAVEEVAAAGEVAPADVLVASNKMSDPVVAAAVAIAVEVAAPTAAVVAEVEATEEALANAVQTGKTA